MSIVGRYFGHLAAVEPAEGISVSCPPKLPALSTMFLATFDYAVPYHKWYLSFFKLIKDFVVLPNEGDHSLMLCKAYLHFSTNFNVLYCYFLLGHRLKVQYLPW